MTPLAQVRLNIQETCIQAERSINEVSLIAVSKTWPVERITPLIDGGQTTFGENKLQELEQKSPALPEDLEWHFIGTIQSNKIRKILRYSNWIHSVGSLKHLRAIQRISQEEGHHPHLFLQVNIDQEHSKDGFSPQEVVDAAQEAAELSHITLEGLMAIPMPQESPELMRPAFRSAYQLQAQLRDQLGLKLPSLSMGMSSDYQIAIEEGATHIRVGSALFGQRTYAPTNS